jgi:hypothetical protein
MLKRTELNTIAYLNSSRPPGQARTFVTLLLVVVFMNFGPARVAFGQGVRSIPQLRQQIALLVAVDKKQETTSEVKNVNAEFLKQRRMELQAALNNKARALRNYHSAVGDVLTAEEKREIEDSIRDLQEEAQKITDAMLVNSPQGESPSARRGSTLATLPSSANSAPATFQSDCYPDAPQALLQEIRAAAQQSVDNADSTEVTSQFFPILFFATAHAISVDAVNVEKEKRDLINRIEIARLREQTKRTDKQVGASAVAEGSTTAAEKPGFAELLGFAIEHGAIQKEVNGTTLTLSSSPYALVVAGQGDTASTYQKYGYLSRVGISANFNIDNENNNVLANARRNQLGEWSIRARLTADRSDRSRDAEEIWNGIRDRFAQPDLILTGELATQFRTDPVLAAKRREIEDRFLSPSYSVPATAVIKDTSLSREQKIDQIAKLILCQVKTDIFDQVRSGAFRMDAATRERIINNTLPALDQALQVKEAAIKTFEDGLKRLSFKPVLTLAYTNKRDPVTSDYSTLKLLYQKKSLEGLSIVANGGISFYHKPNQTMNQTSVRDFAAALSFEGNAGRSPFLSGDLDESPITFSFTGRYQRLLENRHTIKKADIAVAQFKLEIPIATGFSLPFSVSYANATELINESHVRTNFGFTIDTDKILQVLKLNNLQKK